MSALTCDICGGNLAMNESGEFAICESCGMKHTKERVKVKVQEVKGVVEITKGEAEKERLLKNAEAFIGLKEPQKALSVYRQLINDYPDDVNLRIQLAKCIVSLLPSYCTKEELIKYKTAFSEYIAELLDVEKKAILLEPNAHFDFEKMWEEHQVKVEKYTKELVLRYQQNDCFEDLFFEVLSRNNFIPQSTRKLLSILKENAEQLTALLPNANCIKRINRVGVKEYNKTIAELQRAQTSLPEIQYLSVRDCVIVFPNVRQYVKFNKNYTIEELKDKIINPTENEIDIIDKLNTLYSIIQRIPDDKKVAFVRYIAHNLKKTNYNPTADDFHRTTYDIKNVAINLNTDVKMGNLSLTLSYDCQTNQYSKTLNSTSSKVYREQDGDGIATISNREQIELTGTDQEMAAIAAFNINEKVDLSSICERCGGTITPIGFCNKCGCVNLEVEYSLCEKLQSMLNSSFDKYSLFLELHKTFSNSSYIPKEPWKNPNQRRKYSFSEVTTTHIKLSCIDTWKDISMRIGDKERPFYVGSITYGRGDFKRIFLYMLRHKGKCQHCGASFKGIFNKVCSKCGNPKDY